MEIARTKDKPIHTLLFDLDGTLIDSKDIIIKAAYETLLHYQSNEITYQELQSKFGMDLGTYLAKRLPEREAQQFFVKEKEKMYIHSPLFPNVKEGLSQLAEQFQLGIVTNQQKQLVEKVMQHHEIIPYFDKIITKDDVRKGKPSPEPIHLAIEKLSANLEHTILVGDTLFDSQAATAAGIPYILLDHYAHQDNTRGHMFPKLLDYLTPKKEAQYEQ